MAFLSQRNLLHLGSVKLSPRARSNLYRLRTKKQKREFFTSNAPKEAQQLLEQEHDYSYPLKLLNSARVAYIKKARYAREYKTFKAVWGKPIIDLYKQKRVKLDQKFATAYGPIVSLRRKLYKRSVKRKELGKVAAFQTLLKATKVHRAEFIPSLRPINYRREPPAMLNFLTDVEKKTATQTLDELEATILNRYKTTGDKALEPVDTLYKSIAKKKVPKDDGTDNYPDIKLPFLMMRDKNKFREYLGLPKALRMVFIRQEIRESGFLLKPDNNESQTAIIKKMRKESDGTPPREPRSIPVASVGLRTIDKPRSIMSAGAPLIYKRHKMTSRGLRPDKRHPFLWIFKDYPKYVEGVGHPASFLYRKAKLIIKVSEFDLPPAVNRRFLDIVGNRFDSKTGLLTLVSDTKPEPEQNRKNVYRILRQCLEEAWKADLNFIPLYDIKLLPHVQVEMELKDEAEYNKRMETEAIENYKNPKKFTFFSFPMSVVSPIKSTENEKEVKQVIEKIRGVTSPVRPLPNRKKLLKKEFERQDASLAFFLFWGERLDLLKEEVDRLKGDLINQKKESKEFHETWEEFDWDEKAQYIDDALGDSKIKKKPAVPLVLRPLKIDL